MLNSDSRTDRPDATPTPRALTPVAAGSVLGRVVALLVFTGLALGLVVPKVAGGVFLLLSAIAVVWLEPALTRRRGMSVLVPGDRALLAAVLGFVGLWVAAWSIHGLGPIGTDDVGRTLRLLLIIPLYLFLRRVDGLDAALWSGLTIGALLAGVHAVGATLQGVEGPWQGRVGGATNPIYFGGVALAFALALLPRASSSSVPPFERFAAAIAVLAALLATALSGSRGAWIALPLLLTLYVFSLARGQRPLQRFGWPVAVAAAVLVLSLLPGIPLGERFVDAFASIQQAEQPLDPWDTLAVRLELWRVAGDSIAAHPLLGGGPGAYRAALEAAAASSTLNPELLRYEHPHSQYLSALVISGPLGLLALFALFGVPMVLAVRSLASDQRAVRHLAWSAVATVGVLTVVALSESIFQRNAGVVWFALLSSLTLARARAQEWFEPGLRQES